MEHLQADNHPELFPWVLVVMSAISLQCFMIPFVYTVRVRSQVFSKEFMSQFEKEHKEAFPEDDITKSIGFPDMGSGYYSKKLAYKDWLRFNNAQRVHYNFLEALPIILILLFIAGLKQPLAALIIGCVYFVARLIYFFSYIKNPNLRVLGVIPMSLSLFALFGLSLYTASEYMKMYNVDLGM
jgi:uncharacterized membrane protein YecN with MAPEG domain